MPFYLTPKQDEYNQIPELQVCIAEALYDAEAVLSNPADTILRKIGPGGFELIGVSVKYFCKRFVVLVFQ